MDDITRAKSLPIALKVIGLLFILAIYPMMAWIWPAGWGWTPPQHEYELLIFILLAMLGIFLIRATKNPAANISLIWFTIWFTIWLNLAYATSMLLMVLDDRTEQANLAGNIPVQYLVAGILWYLMPSHNFYKNIGQ